MTSKEEKERLESIIVMSGLRKGDFSKKIDVLHQSLNAILNMKNDVQYITRNISKLGFSIDWLYTGEGHPVFKGEQVSDTLNILDNYNERDQKRRISNWIIENYDSISQFSFDRNLDEDELEDVLYRDGIISPSLYAKLDNAGLNLKWSVCGKGSPYNNRVLGKKLSNRKRS